MEEVIKAVRQMTDDFEKEQGRRPRIMMAKMGQDGNEQDVRIFATAYADMGFDVDMGPLFQTPEEVAQDAADNDVHIVDTRYLSAEHKTLLPQLVEELADMGREDIMVVYGGKISAEDSQFLYQHGISAIYGVDFSVADCAKDMMTKLNKIMADYE